MVNRLKVLWEVTHGGATSPQTQSVWTSVKDFALNLSFAKHIVQLYIKDIDTIIITYKDNQHVKKKKFTQL